MVDDYHTIYQIGTTVRLLRECIGRGIYSIFQVSLTVRSDCGDDIGLWAWDRVLLPTQTDLSIAQPLDRTGRDVYLCLCIFGWV